MGHYDEEDRLSLLRKRHHQSVCQHPNFKVSKLDKFGFARETQCMECGIFFNIELAEFRGV